jgi:hypothetical protein
MIRWGILRMKFFISKNQESTGKRRTGIIAVTWLRDSCVSEVGCKRNQPKPFMAFNELLGFIPQPNLVFSDYEADRK